MTMLIKPPTPSAKQVLIMIAMAVILAGLVVDRVNTWWKQRQAVAAAIEPLEGKIVATDGINADGAQADQARSDDDQAANTAANTFRNAIARSHRDDPTAAARAARPVPASVRDAFRARRIAIERSQCAGADCGATATEPDAAQR
jgi:hypothetical protein